MPSELAINFTTIWLGDQILRVRQQMLSNRNGKTWDFYMLSHLAYWSEEFFKSQGRGINNDFGYSKLTWTTLVQLNSTPVHNRAFTPPPISETFRRSQGSNTSSSIEQDFQTDGLENFRKILISGKFWLRKEFQIRLLTLPQIPEDQALQLITKPLGKMG